MENNQSSKVRHIPIFVEGRDEPIVNKDHNSSQNSAGAQATATNQNSSNSSSSSAFASAESSSGPFPQQQQQSQQHHHQNPYFSHQNHNFGRPPMGFEDEMAFGDIPMPHGSIFERAKDFPVRADFNDFFGDRFRAASPRRSESPINHHQQPRKSPSGGTATGIRTSSSGDRQVPVQMQHENVKRASTPQRQSTPPKQHQQHHPQEQAVPPPPQQQQQPPLPPQNEQPQNATAAKQKAIEDSITKIQKIQQSVLDLMARVEKYDGKDRKEYMFLDEMLTQNLLKLDNIDAEGKDNIKNARREAIKCINSLISLLEAKNDEATAAAASDSANVQKSQSNDEASKNADQTPPQPPPPTSSASSDAVVNGASKNSSYDNVNQVQETGVPEKSAEASLEEKVANAMSKQEG